MPAIAEAQLPALLLFIEHCALKAVVETQVRRQFEALGALLQVGADFRLRRELPRPVRVGRKGKRVHMGLHVTGAAWVVVVPPGAAEGVGLLGDKEVGEPGFLEFDRHTQAGEARADDGDVDGFTVGIHRLSLMGIGCAPVFVLSFR